MDESGQNSTCTYLFLLLLHVELLLKLPRAFKTGCYVQLLRRVQFVQVDITKAKVLANQLLGGHSLRSNKNETSLANKCRY